MRSPVLSGASISKRAADGSKILTDVSIELSEGQLVSIVGPSGAGKSTLLSLLGLLDTPSAGIVSLHGERIDNLGRRRTSEIRRNQIGFLFQSVHLLLGLSALENVLMGLAYSGVSRTDRLARARDALQLVGLDDLAERQAATLSGGERQRVALARAIVRRPAVLLCDEPTGSLDPESGSRIIELLKAESTRGTAVLVVTHSLELAAHSGRVVRLKGGGLSDAAD